MAASPNNFSGGCADPDTACGSCVDPERAFSTASTPELSGAEGVRLNDELGLVADNARRGTLEPCGQPCPGLLHPLIVVCV